AGRAGFSCRSSRRGCPRTPRCRSAERVSSAPALSRGSARNPPRRRPTCWDEPRAFSPRPCDWLPHPFEVSVFGRGIPTAATCTAPPRSDMNRHVSLYGIVADLRRERPTPATTGTLDMVLAELGRTRDNLKEAVANLEGKPLPGGGKQV